MFKKIRYYLNKIDKLLFVYFVFLFSEILTKILDYYSFEYYRISVIFKFLFIGWLIVASVSKLHKNEKKTFSTIAILLGFFLLGSWINSLGGGWQNLTNNLVYFTKYVFIFFLYDYFITFPKSSKENLFKVVELFLLFNSVLIILAAIFEITLLETYLSQSRFGYNGLLYMNSQSSYIYIFLIAVYLNKYVLTNIFKIKYLLIIVASILTGTKAILLFLILMFLYLFLNKKWYANKFFYLVFVVGLLLWPRLIQPYVFEKTIGMSSMIKDHGIIAVLLSGRNYILQEVLFLLSHKYSILSYLFGGFPFYDLRAELGFVDVFLFFGIFGGIVYLFFYINTVFKELYRIQKPFVVYFLISLILIVLLGGNYFTNAIIAIYILVFVNQLQEDNRSYLRD